MRSRAGTNSQVTRSMLRDSRPRSSRRRREQGSHFDSGLEAIIDAGGLALSGWRVIKGTAEYRLCRPGCSRRFFWRTSLMCTDFFHWSVVRDFGSCVLWDWSEVCADAEWRTSAACEFRHLYRVATTRRSAGGLLNR